MNEILQFFNYDHLPAGQLRETSKQFFKLAHEMDEGLTGCAELSAGLRKLLEAKDCCVRAAMLTPGS